MANEEALSVHDEILAAVQENDDSFVEKHAKETAATYTKRMHRAVTDLPEDVWNSLGEAAQEWYNNGVSASDAGGEIPLIPGGPVDSKRGAKPAAEEVAEESGRKAAARKALAKKAAAPEPAPVRKAAGKKAAAPVRKAAAKKAAAPAEPVRKAAAKKAAGEARKPTDSPMAKLREFLVKNTDADFEAMRAFCDKKDYAINDSTLRTARYWINSTIGTVKHLGHWQD